MNQDNGTAQDKYPELSFIPTTYCSKSIKIWRFMTRFDYVQDINRNNSSESFHILYKDGKFGVLMHQTGCLRSTSKVALPAKYDYKIELVSTTQNSFIAIINQNKKYGIFLWKNKLFGATKYKVPTIYDSMTFDVEKRRFMATKDGVTTYFDMTGHILK